jgi:hypothetical protein
MACGQGGGAQIMKRRFMISGSHTAADGFIAGVKVQCEAFLQHAGAWRKVAPKPGMDAAKPLDLNFQISTLSFPTVHFPAIFHS